LPYKEPKIEKVYYSIGEVAEMFGVNSSLLRFWEQEFDFINPKKTRKGTRQYTKKDIGQIRLVFHLVKERGMTLKGARMKIRENRDEVEHNHEVIKKLQEIRQLLVDLDDQL